MKTKIIIMSIFAVILITLLIGLLVIIFTNDNEEELPKIVDYVIENKSETCVSALELIYEDKNNSYYLSCIKSNYIYLKWDDGEIDLLKNALDNKKVTIDSLIEHGLDVIVNEK